MDTKNKKDISSANRRKYKAEDKEKIREILEARGEEIEAAADKIAPDFDFESESLRLEAEDSRAEAIEVEREEVKERIRELLVAEYEKLQLAADKIAPDFDYEAEAAELEAEEADFIWADDKRREEEERQRIEAERLEAERKAEEERIEAERKAEEERQRIEAERLEAERKAEEEARERARKEAEWAKPLPAAVVSHSRYPRDRYVPRTGLGRLALRDRHSVTLTAAILLLVVFAGLQACDYLIPKDITLSLTTYAGTQNIDYKTTTRNVGDLIEELTDDENEQLDAAGIDIEKTDIFSYDDEYPVDKDLELGIMHATKTTAKIAGKETEVWLVPGTIEENLERNEITYDEDDEISPDLDEQVDDDTNIVVDEIHYDVRDKNETILAVSKVILDPSLTSGVQVTEEGNDGEGIYTYTTRYKNGEKGKTKKKLKEWVTEPHDHVLRLGTASTGNSGEYIIARTFTANTTAYSARPGARGALGMPVHVGTCAVDPRFVSLRSELWVEGYGYAYAMDTGGAVKGNVVDLYMSSNGQCIQWGRRNKTAYVLQPAG